MDTLRTQVVVMDLHMPDDKLITPLQIKASLNGARLISISLWEDDESKKLADNLGAVALLDKMHLVADLIPAIKKYAGTRPS